MELEPGKEILPQYPGYKYSYTGAELAYRLLLGQPDGWYPWRGQRRCQMRQKNRVDIIFIKEVVENGEENIDYRRRKNIGPAAG